MQQACDGKVLTAGGPDGARKTKGKPTEGGWGMLCCPRSSALLASLASASAAPVSLLFPLSLSLSPITVDVSPLIPFSRTSFLLLFYFSSSPSISPSPSPSPLLIYFYSTRLIILPIPSMAIILEGYSGANIHTRAPISRSNPREMRPCPITSHHNQSIQINEKSSL